MQNYSIDTFWMKRLEGTSIRDLRPVRGWSVLREGFPVFMEAPLTQSQELDGAKTDPMNANIILVSAPGAVGKSTLAQEIAFRSKSLYVDLSNSDPVGGNTVSGGLAKSGLFDLWEKDCISIIIDGLDEARIRVTQDSYSAFIEDIIEISKGRKMPTVLFGRTGSVQDTWLLLDNDKISSAVLEIGYYGLEDSIEFAFRRLNNMSSHASREREAIEEILKRLRQRTESDGDRFAGYAPVLQAVARRVGDGGNAGAIVSQIKSGEFPITLRTVANDIMERERTKLQTLPLSDRTLLQKLYLFDEQLDRLAARRYGGAEPELPVMSAEDEQAYRTALESWVDDHPFIKAGTNMPSSAVFDGLISAWAMRKSKISEKAINRELSRRMANPFLSEFYFPEDDGDIFIPPDHIGVVYSSFRARLSLGDSASLNVSTLEKEEAGEDEDEDVLRAEGEIVLARKDESSRTIHFQTDQVGVLRLGAHIEDVEVNAPYMKVEIGPGPEAVFISPVIMQCDCIRISSEKILVEAHSSGGGGVVFLESSQFDGDVGYLPIIRGDVSLRVCWPGAQVHPWNSFYTNPTVVEDPKLAEALHRFRKFIISFRSHSKGSLARFSDKLNHKRMTKGSGRSVLDLLIKEGIIYLNGAMYYLDPDRLGSVSGANYKDCMEYNFSSETIDFIKRALI